MGGCEGKWYEATFKGRLAHLNEYSMLLANCVKESLMFECLCCSVLLSFPTHSLGEKKKVFFIFSLSLFPCFSLQRKRSGIAVTCTLSTLYLSLLCGLFLLLRVGPTFLCSCLSFSVSLSWFWHQHCCQGQFNTTQTWQLVLRHTTCFGIKEVTAMAIETAEILQVNHVRSCKKYFVYYRYSGSE